MNKKLFARSYIVTLMTLLTITACGKNMHVAVNGAKATPDASTGVIDTTKKDSTKTDLEKADDAAKKEEIAVIATNTTEAVKKINSANPVEKVKAEQMLYDGLLHPYSVFDLSELASKRPFLNKESDTNSIREIQDPAFMDSKIHSGFVKESNLVFRAIVGLPKKEEIKSILRFELELGGLRYFSMTPSLQKKIKISNQVLCMADTKVCSGDQPAVEDANLNSEFWKGAKLVSDEFSQVEVTRLFDYGANGSVYEAESHLVLDMKKLFNLESLSSEQLVEWIFANSTEYAEPGYRKFRFVMANNMFLEVGRLVIQVESTRLANEPVGKLKNGDTDAQFPVSAQASIEGEVDAVKMTPSDRPSEESINQQIAEEKKAADAEKASADKAASDKAASDKAASDKAASDKAAADAAAAAAASATTSKVGDAVVTGKETAMKKDGQVAGVSVQSEAPAEPVRQLEALKPVQIVIAPALTQITVNMKLIQPEIQISLDGAQLTFELDKALIMKDGKAKLAATAALIKQNQASIAKVNVVGHTDKTGKPDYNKDLSKKRANAVATVLLKSGVEKAKLFALGKGEPAKSSCDPKQICEQDRRVDIKMTLVGNLTAAQKKSIIQSLNAGLAQVWKK